MRRIKIQKHSNKNVFDKMGHLQELSLSGSKRGAKLWDQHSLSVVKPISYIPKQIKNNEVNLVDFLNNININFSNISKDGRINSCLDEDIICNLLSQTYTSDILQISTIRTWYDLKIKNY